MLFYEKFIKQAIEILEQVEKIDCKIIWEESNSKTFLGQCEYIDNDTCKIRISKNITNDEEILHTVVHELIHSLKKCRHSGHKGNFAKVAHHLYEKTGFVISRTGTLNGSKKHELIEQKKATILVFRCKNCGLEFTRQRKPNFFKYLDFCYCPKCKQLGTLYFAEKREE